MIKYLKAQATTKISNKVSLLRIDLNIENVHSTFGLYRLDAAIPTVKFLLNAGNKVVILSHIGRPSGKEKKLSLKPFVKLLEKRLNTKVVFFSDFNWKKIAKEVKKAEKNFVFLVENLRFLEGETKNSMVLAKQMSSLGDFYVNDAFSVCHRKNASVVAITNFLPSFGGLLLEREIMNLDKVMKEYQHPFTVIIGGAKIGDKLGVIKNFFEKADYFLLGGGPANTFLKAEGMDIGKSLFDEEYISKLGKYLNSNKIFLPVDIKMKNLEILDIGKKTIREYRTIIKKSRTIIWSGPLGFFEKKEFAQGTKEVWKEIFANKRAKIVVGGGETVSSLDLFTNSWKTKILQKKNIFISTGGGAMLKYLSGDKLPGIEALK